MPIRLPLDSLTIPARQIGAHGIGGKVARYDCAVVFLPVAPAAADWTAVPFGDLLRELYERKSPKPGDSVQLRVGTHAKTLLVAVCTAVAASTFERLQAGGKLARLVLDGEPESVVLLARGVAWDDAQGAFHATIAALEAAAFRFATFKSAPRPKGHRSLARIDIAAGEKLVDLDLTLATAGGNNLARWLTALPPNTLDARGYRRLAEEFAQHLGLGFKFYGESQLKRLGAGAFLAVSQGNATRDAGIAHLFYRGAGGSRTRGAPAVSLVGKGICFDTAARI